MTEQTITVGPEEGLHARPAAQFVRMAQSFLAEIIVIKDDREADAKSPLKLMTLAAGKGDEITIRAIGDDADEAVDALAVLISGQHV